MSHNGQKTAKVKRKGNPIIQAWSSINRIGQEHRGETTPDGRYFRTCFVTGQSHAYDHPGLVKGQHYAGRNAFEVGPSGKARPANPHIRAASRDRYSYLAGTADALRTATSDPVPSTVPPANVETVADSGAGVGATSPDAVVGGGSNPLPGTSAEGNPGSEPRKTTEEG